MGRTGLEPAMCFHTTVLQTAAAPLGLLPEFCFRMDGKGVEPSLDWLQASCSPVKLPHPFYNFELGYANLKFKTQNLELY